MKRLYYVVFLITIVCSSAVFKEEKVTVAVAANAQYALKEIEQSYKRETGKDVELIIGSSGKLTAQIKAGAPFDVFLSADMDYPQTLYTEGYTLAKPSAYAYGALVLWTMKDFEKLTIHTTLSPEVTKIAVANPKVAPYGEAAISVLNYYKLFDKVHSKLIYGESIAQVTQYVISNAVELGFTAKSVVLSPEMKGKGKWIDLDRKSYKPIAQGAVLLKSASGRNAKGAEQFYHYLFSDEAKNIFKKYGYEFE